MGKEMAFCKLPIEFFLYNYLSSNNKNYPKSAVCQAEHIWTVFGFTLSVLVVFKPSLSDEQLVINRLKQLSTQFPFFIHYDSHGLKDGCHQKLQSPGHLVCFTMSILPFATQEMDWM